MFWGKLVLGVLEIFCIKKNEKRNPAVRAGGAASAGAQVGRGAEKLQSRGI